MYFAHGIFVTPFWIFSRAAPPPPQEGDDLSSHYTVCPSSDLSVRMIVDT